ncbi:MAG: hypothetical protein LBH93_05485 [Chitinispirillales bacterium]|jgi:hypothetical protein|nr:hypothetical protein [Chitinispirillales bacterium]
MTRTIKIAAAALLLCAALSAAGLLDGYYQITGLTLKYNDKDERGFNNTGLYISASDKRIRIAGAWRGYPIMRAAIIEKTISDTIILRDAENPQSVYKFQIRNNTIVGRHSITDENGSRQIIDSKATVRKLNQGEVDKIRAIINF